MAAGATTGDEDFKRLGHDEKFDAGWPGWRKNGIWAALMKILKQILNINQFPKPGEVGILTGKRRIGEWNLGIISA